jgi:hypothetical protein
MTNNNQSKQSSPRKQVVQINTPKLKAEAIVIYGKEEKTENSPGAKNLSEEFRWAAEDHARKLKERYSNVKLIAIYTGGDFLNLLMQERKDTKIRELHIFSHAWNTGLSLNYGELKSQEKDIQTYIDIYGKNIRFFMDGSDDFQHVRTSQLRISNFHFLNKEQITKIREIFSPVGVIRIWGCNAGNDASGISQTFANYCGIATWGSQTGTSFWVLQKGKEKWEEYDKKGRLNRRFKLNGVYKKFSPENSFKPELRAVNVSISWFHYPSDKEIVPELGGILHNIRWKWRFEISVNNISSRKEKVITFFSDQGRIDARTILVDDPEYEHSYLDDEGNVVISKRNICRIKALYRDLTIKGKIEKRKIWIEIQIDGQTYNSKGKSEIQFLDEH